MNCELESKEGMSLTYWRLCERKTVWCITRCTYTYIKKKFAHFFLLYFSFFLLKNTYICVLILNYFLAYNFLFTQVDWMKFKCSLSSIGTRWSYGSSTSDDYAISYKWSLIDYVSPTNSCCASKGAANMITWL